MNLQSLPSLKRPELRNAEAAHRHSKALETHQSVTGAYNAVSQDLAALDGSDYDYNPNPGEVVVVDQYLDYGPDTSIKVRAAELRFDPTDGQVDRFKMIKKNDDAFTYEHQQFDEHQSSSPTFGVVHDGNNVEFDLNPNTGLITALRD